MTIFFLTLLFPVLFLAREACREHFQKRAAWVRHLLVATTLFGAGTYAARPFVQGTALGTGEAYNYSLSVADAVTQFRQGVFPALVGQSEFAFNGRIHPLRTAPYFCYAAGLLDLLTFRRLTFWELQNALLALSLVGATFSFYWVLNRIAKVSRPASCCAAVLYVLSPLVMAVTYGMDLYMTVTALPYVPLALGACMKSFSERSPRVYLLMGISVGFLWLAHPPIAVWTSTVVLVLQAGVWVTRRPTLRAAGSVLLGAVAGVAVALFAFVSTLTMQDVRGFGNRDDYSPMFVEIARAFPGCLLPVSSSGNQISDFQLGYPLWAVWLCVWVWALWRRSVLALTLVALATTLLVLTLPIPHVTRPFWGLLPPILSRLTNIWPMQRLYVVIGALVLLAGGLAWREIEPRVCGWSPTVRRAGLGVLFVMFGWTFYQANPFLAQALLNRTAAVGGFDLQRSENLDPTVISYAMLGLPPYFTYGVIDPSRAFILLKAEDQTEIANNWTPAGDPGPLVASGSFSPAELISGQLIFGDVLRIRPGVRYVLQFKFRVPPLNGSLLIEGENFFRQYPLPVSGEPRSFGMKPENNHSLVLWTTRDGGEELKVRIVGAGVDQLNVDIFADYQLYELDPTHYPVQVENFVPLRGQVRAGKEIWLETPRRFIPGYAATVDGQPVATTHSPDYSVMFRVPAGDHRFELRYDGPPVLRKAFWISFATLCLLAAGGVFWIGRSAARELRARLSSA